MVILGIILAGAAVCVAVGIIADNSAPATMTLFGQHVPGVTSQAQVFIAGVVIAIFFVIGLMLSYLSLARSMRVRRELRDLREEHEESLSAMEYERQQLQRELARARNSAGAIQTTTDIPVAGQRTRDPVSPFFDQSA
jgi:Na+/melibiose symporter-like transporter